MPRELVTIATFEKPEDAYLIRSVLEGSGIECFVEGDLVVNVAWIYSNAIGGVKVQVRPEDADQALETIEQTKQSKPKTAPFERQCPHCSSGKIEYQRWSPTVFFLSLLLLGAPLPFLKGKYRCLDCLRDWPVASDKRLET